MSKKTGSNSNEKKISNKSKKSIPIKFTWTRFFIFLIIIGITLGVGFGFKEPIENLLNNSKNIEAIGDVSQIDDNGLSVHFIDIGQGDAIAIRFPDGKTMLVDAGKQKHYDKLNNYLVNNFFKNNNKVFDYLLLTHSDEDHCGGMPNLCADYIINTIYRPFMYCKYIKGDINYDETNGNATNKNICETLIYYKTIKAFKSEINSNGQSAQVIWTDLDTVNSAYKIKSNEFGYSIDFYAPTQKYITSSAGTIANDFSPIMVLNYNGKKIMLTGDASKTSEMLAMQNADLPDVDLLKVGHHGSKSSSCQEFLEKIKPEIAVISVNNKEYNKLPATEAMNRILNVGATIFRTDENGTIIANITSEPSSKLNIYALGQGQTIYIHVEYLMSGIIVIVAGLCFNKKIKFS